MFEEELLDQEMETGRFDFQENSIDTNNKFYEKKNMQIIEFAITEEIRWIALLEKLMGSTIDIKKREILRQIRLDDQKHLELFRDIYHKISGDIYSDKRVESIDIVNYKEAVLLKIGTVEFYRQIYNLYSDKNIKDILFEIITDQQNHAIIFAGLG